MLAGPNQATLIDVTFEANSRWTGRAGPVATNLVVHDDALGGFHAMTAASGFPTLVGAATSGLLLAVLMTGNGCMGSAGREKGHGGGGPPMMGGGAGHMMGGPNACSGHGMMMGPSTRRHHVAVMGGIPPAYERLRDPLSPSPKVIAAGRALYLANCAVCHGDDGAGHGPAATGMSPPPADLRWLVRRPMAGDGYLMWAISEGGGALGTAMPAFRGTLVAADRWRIITFLRTL